MFRFAFLLSLAGLAQAGVPPVDMDSAAQLYQEAAIREQVRASLGSMPATYSQTLPRQHIDAADATRSWRR